MKKINSQTVDGIDRFIESYLLKRQLYFGDNKDATRKILHTRSCCKIFDMLNCKYDSSTQHLIRVAIKAHDIGRFEQLRMIDSYDDKIIHHAEIGADLIETAIENNMIPDSPEIRSIQLIIKYHGTIEFLKQSDLLALSPRIVEWARLVTIVDDIENVCITGPTRLESEIVKDSKHLLIQGIDQKRVSTGNMITYFKKKKIDRKNCRTYADYILFHLSIIRKFLYEHEYKELTEELLVPDAIHKYLCIIDKFIIPSQGNIIKLVFQNDMNNINLIQTLSRYRNKFFS
jgi:hypothetical protein